MMHHDPETRRLYEKLVMWRKLQNQPLSTALYAVLDSTGTGIASSALPKFTGLLGDGVATSYSITHGLASSALLVQCWLVATPFTLQTPTSIAIPDDDTVVVTFGSAPASNSVRVVII